MKHPETVKAFEEEFKRLKKWITPNSYSLLVRPNIADYEITEVRKICGIGACEEILFIRDTSMFSTKPELVITDCAIYDKKNKDKILTLLWNKIELVTYEYKSECLYFFVVGEDDDYLPIDIRNFTYDLDKSESLPCGLMWGDVLTNISKKQKKISNETAQSKCDTYKIERLERERKELGASFFTPFVVKWYFENDKKANALRILEEDIKELIDIEKSENDKEKLKANEKTLLNLCFQKYRICKELGDFVEARKACMYVLNHAKANDTFICNDENMLEKAEEDIKELDAKNLGFFTEMNLHDRRLLLPVDKRLDLSRSNKVLVFDIRNLPSQLRFTAAHPVANQLYIEHPYNKGLYLPFENYELVFIKEKVSEYCKVMQALGATEIKIEVNNTKDTSSKTEKNTKVSGEANIKASSGSAEYKDDTKNEWVDKLKRSMNFHQKYTPRGEPRLPENLVWYAGDKSIQDIYDQRMMGITEHHATIETEKSQVVNNSELEEISGELEYLLSTAKVNWEESRKSMFETHENAYLSINVTFAPLKELRGKRPQLSHQEEAVPISDNSQKEGYSEVEKEYMEYTQELLEEYSEISPRERRILNKRREKLGISEERATELESISQKATLTEEEKEYMEYVQDWLEESPELSHSTRRVLNKRREKLGISEERAAELEEMAKK